MPSSPPQPSATPFVIAGFIFMWVVGFYPLLASVAAMYSALAAIILLVTLPLIMAAVLFPLWRRQEKEAGGAEG